MKHCNLLFVAAVVAVLLGTPALAYDWIVTAHVTRIETTYAPGPLPIIIDQAAGSCIAGTGLMWLPQGATLEERIASYNAALATFMSAQAAGTTITVLGLNSGCQIQFVYRN